jgi:hypothetical protein
MRRRRCTRAIARSIDAGFVFTTPAGNEGIPRPRARSRIGMAKGRLKAWAGSAWQQTLSKTLTVSRVDADIPTEKQADFHIGNAMKFVDRFVRDELKLNLADFVPSDFLTRVLP